ncbi:GntP family permease [Cellulomonas oligotrophica]|uniref:Gluconate transporter n=1 Tax=Cellulomonas oligotrophica TaxID=931536 RepID=A0A7Y9FIQ9_9CELL|nr:GntP family permease [Cellulomonas oligotrophica]NYD88060.1 GntP family gluconate:H+ symporter [Cellulomonas oligotrophica]GIG33568.1 gluconate transporter [Cellulomonas oligotrophica]
MDDWTQTLGAGPLLGIAAGAIALILVLVIRFRVHAFLTLVVVSLLTAVATGIPTGSLVDVLLDGFGGTLASVALLIGLGAMLGKLVEHSGGARVLADALVGVFGEKRAVLALGLASLALGFPIFFDAGLIVMLPIIFAVARRLGGDNVLLYGIPAAAAFSVMHVFVPPHPGPVAATELYGANLGIVLLVGLLLAVPTWYVAGYLWGLFVGRRIVLPVPALFGDVDDDQPTDPPRVATVVGVLLLPLVLIFLNTGLDALGTAGVVDPEAGWVQALTVLGSSGVALLISVLVASVVLGTRRGVDKTALEKVLDSSLGPVCSVILITGAGGMFGGVLRASGIGDALSSALESVGLPVIVAAYLIALLLRVAQGSATVALVTAAGLAAPAVAAGDFTTLQVACIVLATAAGSVFASHVNDSGFWLVGRLMGMDVKTTLKTWTVQQALQSVVAFAVVLVVYGVASTV